MPRLVAGLLAAVLTFWLWAGWGGPLRLVTAAAGAAWGQEAQAPAAEPQQAQEGQGAPQPAQQAAPTLEEYTAWEGVATRAGEAIEDAQASTRAFESLRQQLVEWRARFQEAQKHDASEIASLKARIDALGPPPEDGVSEGAMIAVLRSDLDAEYRRLVAPVRRAEEAHARAQGLISRIDRLIRERQRERLMERGPSPLNPANIRVAVSDLEMVVRRLGDEMSASFRSATERREFRNNLPQIVILLTIAALLLVSGQRLFQRIIRQLVARRSLSDGTFVVAMILSLAQFILPAIGFVALTLALRLTGMFGSAGEGLLDAAATAGAAFFFTRWIAGQTFPRMIDWPVTLKLSARQRVRGRFYANGLGTLIAAAILVEATTRQFSLQNATTAVLAFPIIVLVAISLDGLGRLIAASGTRPESDLEAEGPAELSAERHFLARTGRFLGHACRVFAVVGPVLAATGFLLAAVYSTVSPVLTLQLIALVTFLQRLSSGLFRLFGPHDREGDGLFAVLANFLIVFASLPVLALIWGARLADLDEFWTALNDGFTFGGIHISPSVLVVLLVVFVAGYLLTRLVQGAVGSSVLPRTSLDPGAQKAVNAGLGYIGIFASAMIAISMAGLDLSNLAIVAGALSVGVGFGLQNIVSNFVSGLILLIERPVTEGDWVEVGGVMGTVRRISVRATTVETFDRTDVVVPNSDFVTGQFTNWTRGSLTGRLILTVGVAYGTDTRKVAAILQEIAEEHPLVIVNPPPLIVFHGFGADALDFEIRVILRDINFGLSVRTEINHRIAERFAEEGIEIPFAQRDIWLRNPEALAAGLGRQSGDAASAPAGPGLAQTHPTETQ